MSNRIRIICHMTKNNIYKNTFAALCTLTKRKIPLYFAMSI